MGARDPGIFDFCFGKFADKRALVMRIIPELPPSRSNQATGQR